MESGRWRWRWKQAGIQKLRLGRKDKFMKSQHLFLILFFLIIGGALYLPFADQFGYYYDDWYSMYLARVAGSDIFHEIYAIDRPGRAYVMAPLYDLFQGIPIYYNWLAVALRIFGSLMFLWFLNLLWSGKKLQNITAASLFLVYPGFLNMPNAIDFQSHLIGVTLAFVSLAVMLIAFRAVGIRKWFLYTMALLAGLAYLSQMEYYIGFEIARVFIIAVVAWRSNEEMRARALRTIVMWLPYALIPGLYLFWRIFLFDNQRRVTDVTAQLGRLVESPLVAFYEWSFALVQSVLNVSILAWGVPLTQIGFSLGPLDTFRAVVLGMLVAAFGVAGLLFLSRHFQAEDSDGSNRQTEAFWLGLAWLFVGLIAVVLANRSVTFPDYSRYGIVSAPGAILLLVALITQINQRRFQAGLLLFLFFSAGMTHYANGVKHAAYSADLQSFWWQVSWRVPHVHQNTTFVAQYPYAWIRETSAVWGPANQIYYPVRVNPTKMQAGVAAVFLDHDTVISAFNRERQVYRRDATLETYPNYRRLLLNIQPTFLSCVHVIDSNFPEFSTDAPTTALLLGEYSRIDNIIIDEPARLPPEFLFGPEPERGWCYYYQKASLARQGENWNEIISLYEQAQTAGFSAGDPVELFPFLHAFLIEERQDDMKTIANQLTSDPFITRQACNLIVSVQGVDEEFREMASELYCLEP
jgi:hypothetical protein